MRFREVIAPPTWLLAFIYFLFSSISISLWAALGNTPALWCQIISTVLLIYIAFRSRLIIEIDDSQLRINKAHIDLKYLGTATTLDIDQMRNARGRDADPSAFLAIRFWSPRGVLVEVKDSRDATPYWLISSKRGDELVQVIN
jgi:hypothetical protein